MIVCNLDPDSDTVTATFTVSGPEHDGQQISVVGDFNDWDPTATVLTPSGKTGAHTATVALQAGRSYRFRYLTEDGEWFDDENADAYEPNEFGGKNCVLHLAAAMADAGQ